MFWKAGVAKVIRDLRSYILKWKAIWMKEAFFFFKKRFEEENNVLFNPLYEKRPQ